MLTRQVRPVCSIGQTGSAKQVRPVAQTGQTGSDQGRSEKLKSKRSKINSGKDRCEHKGKKSKLSFDELLAKYLKENEAKCANRSNVDKSSKMPPKQNSRSCNWQGKDFHSAASYSPLRPSMPILYAPRPTDFHHIHHGGWMIHGHILRHILDHII